MAKVIRVLEGAGDTAWTLAANLPQWDRGIYLPLKRWFGIHPSESWSRRCALAILPEGGIRTLTVEQAPEVEAEVKRVLALAEVRS